jgi:hypothetical protein
MTQFSKRQLLLPLLVLGITLATVATVHVPTSQAATTASLQINFGSAPQWGYVPGTRVREIRQGQHPDYDMFRYGSTYYAYNNDQWYSSRRSHGQFRAIDERYVPMQISRVPRDRWHNYPSRWDNNRRPGMNNPGQGNPGGRDHR